MATNAAPSRPGFAGRLRVTAQEGNAMSRLPDLDPAKFSPEQKKVHEAVLAGPRGRVVGPIKVWLGRPRPPRPRRARAGARRLLPFQFEPGTAAFRACDHHHRRLLEGELRMVRARADGH